jgi:protein-disulfide isomerase
MQLRASFRNTLFAITLIGIAAPLLRAQQTEEVPSAPSATAAAQAQAQAPAPTGPPQFPPVDPKNFTSNTPTKETVDAFLHQLWGYDADRVWQVQAIQKTAAPGVSKVTVLAAQKTNPQIGTLQFFTTPDGQHLISNEIMPFGSRPFDPIRKTLQTEANGPSRGPATKDLMLVEFADFQCPHCKNAQPIIQKLLQDFPNAHYVFEDLPLTSIHSEALKASLYSVCAAKLGGNDAFFKFADNVFTNQASLTPEGSDAALNDAATKAGLDATKVAACSQTPEAKSAVEASIKLAQDLNVNETPYLFVNGRGVPLEAVPYETLKKIVAFEVENDK